MNILSLLKKSTGVETDVGEDGPALELLDDGKLWATEL